MVINLSHSVGVILALLMVSCLIIGLRSLQRSRSTINYQQRLPHLRLARQLFIFSGLIATVSIYIFILKPIKAAVPQEVSSLWGVTNTPTITSTSTPSFRPTALVTSSKPPEFAITRDPSDPGLTPTPILPIPLLARFTSTIAPDPNTMIDNVRFSTELKNNQLVAPGVRFRNPVRTMYVIYSFSHMKTGVQWTAVWYRDGEYLDYETKTWNLDEAGAGIIEYEQDVDKWLPGIYELQIFVGDQWKATGSFTLAGDPPTFTPTPTPTITNTIEPTVPPTVTSTKIPIILSTPL